MQVERGRGERWGANKDVNFSQNYSEPEGKHQRKLYQILALVSLNMVTSNRKPAATIYYHKYGYQHRVGSSNAGIT